MSDNGTRPVKRVSRWRARWPTLRWKGMEFEQRASWPYTSSVVTEHAAAANVTERGLLEGVRRLFCGNVLPSGTPRRFWVGPIEEQGSTCPLAIEEHVVLQATTWPRRQKPNSGDQRLDGLASPRSGRLVLPKRWSRPTEYSPPACSHACCGHRGGGSGRFIEMTHARAGESLGLENGLDAEPV